MAIVCSTKGVHPRDRLSYWVEVANKAFVKHEFVADRRGTFHGEVRSGALGRLGVAVFDCDPCKVIRSRDHVARGDSDDVLLCLQASGKGLYAQDNREAVNAQGSFLLIDTRRPFSINIPEREYSIIFKLVRQDIEGRLGSIESLTARAVPAGGSLGGLASGFLSMLPGRLGAVEGTVGSALSNQALDLLALAISEFNASKVSISSTRSITLLRLKAVIEARLCDPDLRPAAAVAEAGVSIRYGNDLLSLEGFSLERYIMHRRLERCRQALEDAQQARRLIGEIAFFWGFSDLSHFSRRFRAAYGLSPRSYRQRALLLR